MPAPAAFSRLDSTHGAYTKGLSGSGCQIYSPAGITGPDDSPLDPTAGQQPHLDGLPPESRLRWVRSSALSPVMIPGRVESGGERLQNRMAEQS